MYRKNIPFLQYLEFKIKEFISFYVLLFIFIKSFAEALSVGNINSCDKALL